MPRKTINVCGHCNERKATDACVICDTDLCDDHQHFDEYDLYLSIRVAKYRSENPPDATHKYGPFCPSCRESHKWAMTHPSYDRQFRQRVKVAIQNVGNAIAREMFRDREKV